MLFVFFFSRSRGAEGQDRPLEGGEGEAEAGEAVKGERRATSDNPNKKMKKLDSVKKKKKIGERWERRKGGFVFLHFCTTTRVYEGDRKKNPYQQHHGA